jgi:hypothetical protein
MITKSQLEQKITELESELQEFKSQLQDYSEITLENSKPGDTLSDRTVVIHKEGNRILIAAPKETAVYCKWTPEFTEVFESMRLQGFTPSQWHVPTIEELRLAYKNTKDSFSAANYWSSTENSATSGCNLCFSNGTTSDCIKTNTCCVRAFRWCII